MLDQQFSNGEVFEKSFNEFLQANFADQNNRENELKKKGE